MKDSCCMACHAAHSLQHSDARRPSARPPGGQAIMRGIAHFWITSNSAIIQLANIPLSIVHMFLSKHHTKQRKTRKYVTHMRYVSVCAPVDWRKDYREAHEKCHIDIV